MNQKLITKKVRIFDCKNCGNGEIHTTFSEYEQSFKLSIDKCNSCKHQYLFKELSSLEELNTIKVK